ncbi:SUZ domain-containing protein 1 isoform X2 [Aquila chrysaetos chrysaetos]|nr:SUZ domain-containing protein 1 isoform X2 [Aquila chrysaetos chrysaetos]
MAGGEVRMGQQGEEMGPVAMPEGQRVPVLPRRPASMTEVAAQHPGHVPCQIGCPRCLAEAWDYLKGDVEFVHTDEIDRRLEKKLKITQKESRKSKSPPKVPIVIQDDSLPAGPPPQIRILKRPTTNGVLSNPNSASRPAFPVKSLAQREAEYAEARKRILGSASPEEEQEKPILDRPPRISQPEDTRQPNNVIRQPLGPDGSQGFKQRR